MIENEKEWTKHLFISAHSTMPTVHNVMSEKNFPTLEHAYWSSDEQRMRQRNESYAYIDSKYKKGGATRTLVYFAHKVADDLSFVEPLARGQVFKKNGTLKREVPSPIPSITPPYKQEKVVRRQEIAQKRPIEEKPIKKKKGRWSWFICGS